MKYCVKFYAFHELGSSSEINPLFKSVGILSQTSKEAWGVQRQEQTESMECKHSKAKPYQFEGDDKAWTGCSLNSSSGIPPGEALPSLLGTGMKQSLSGCSLNPTIKECKLFYTSDMKVLTSWGTEPWHRRQMGILWASCKALKKFFIQQEFVLNSDGPRWKYQIKWCFQWCSWKHEHQDLHLTDNQQLWGHKTTQKEQIVSSLAMLEGLLWGRRGVWPSVTAWLALGIGSFKLLLWGLAVLLKSKRDVWTSVCCGISLSVLTFSSLFPLSG